MVQFIAGWHPNYRDAANADLVASGRYCTVAPTKPSRPAVSLSQYRINYYTQLNAGTCWIHAPKQMGEVLGKRLGYNAFPICRMLIGYYAKQKYEGGGNASDGGAPTDAVRAMADGGVGLAHESLLPYSDQRSALGHKPPQNVYDDAAKSHIVSPVMVQGLNDILALVDSGHPVANGYSCPDTMQDPDTFLTSYNSILGGHSQLIWGYALPGVFDQYTWLQLDGWWTPMYNSLPPSLAKLVDGYVPTSGAKDTSKWVRSDVYLALCNLQGGAEHVSATDLDGIVKGTVVPSPDFNDVIPI
jgi:hypothetical protein